MPEQYRDGAAFLLEHFSGVVVYTQLCHTRSSVSLMLACRSNLLKRAGEAKMGLAFERRSRYKEGVLSGGCATGMTNLGGGGYSVAQPFW
jgi:hypothetical protein